MGLGNAFYLIDFVNSKKKLKLNLDLKHKGWRGGSLKTRYFGSLGGIDPNLKQEIIEEVKKKKTNLTFWLEKNLKKILKESKK